MEKKTGIEKIGIAICIAILGCFALSVAARFFTKQILIQKFEVRNAITELIWFDNKGFAFSKDNENQEPVVDWAAMYPFEEEDAPAIAPQKESKSAFSKKLAKLTDKIEGAKERIEEYAKSRVMFYYDIIETSYLYEHLIGWNYSSFAEYNGIVVLPDGYLTSYVEKRDTTAQYNALCEFNEYCKSNDMDLLYVNAPYKISKYDDRDISGTVDFSNQNADELLAKLESAGIDTLDIREEIYKLGVSHHSLFFKTDHHWLVTTGMWAAQKILEQCNERYDWNVDTEKMNPDQFDQVTYPKNFLGSQGKKVTLSRVEPDDLTLIYPKYETRFHYEVYHLGVDKTGDYSVCYNMDRLGTGNYYAENPYGVCNYGMVPMVEIENLLDAENKRIVILQGSFGDCVVSGLALGVKNVTALDLREFTGSVKAYLEEVHPDLVIVMYNSERVGNEIDLTGHMDQFDFR